MDDYSDDGFDDLNDTVLQELENKAIQFTQAHQLYSQPAASPRQLPSAPRPPAQHEQGQPSSAYDFSAFEADDLDDTFVVDELAKEPAAVPPVVDKPLPPQQARVVPGAAQPHPAWQHQPGPSGLAALPSMTSQLLPTRPIAQVLPSQRHSGWEQRPQHRPLPAPSQFNRRPPPPPPRYPVAGARPIPPHPVQSSRIPGGAGNPTEIIAALQAQLAAAQAELTASKGEAAIVRSKYEKSQASHETEIARLRRLNAEQLAKQERTVQAALMAEKNATTELQFARQDLKEELGRAKGRRKDDLLMTPKKKNKTWGVADGFDDLEILPSPGKGQGKRRGDPGPVAVPLAERTPTKGKRKRPTLDSPVMALEVHSEDVFMPDAPVAQKSKPKDEAGRYSRSSKPAFHALPSDFLKLALDHSPAHGQPLTFDLFSRYAFPSDSNQSLAAIILDKLPDLGKSPDKSQDEPIRVLVDFSELLMVLWTQCLREEYFPPIYDIVSLLAFTVQLNTTLLVPHIIMQLLPLVQNTCLRITLPRTESANGDLSTHPDLSLRQLSVEINVTQCLSLLYLVALGCIGPSPYGEPRDDFSADLTRLSPQGQFWKHVQLEFVLVLLSPKHPEEDFLGMLSLLCTSVLPDSIGPIPNPSLSLLPANFDRPKDRTPEFAARSLIDRVSQYMSDPPKWAPRGSIKQCRVRLSVLRTLTAFAKSPYGAQQLAASTYLIPRLVVVLSWAVDNLYDMDVPSMTLKGTVADKEKDQHDVDQPTAENSVTGIGKDSGPKDSGSKESGPQDSALDSAEDMPDADAPGGSEQQQQRKVFGADKAVRLQDLEPGTTVLENPSSTKTRLLNQLIAQATALLHFLAMDPRTANLINMQTKLAPNHGASYRYLTTMARIMFAEEDLVYEAGISPKTVELAHDLLELMITPDDGEGVGEVFGN